VPKSRHGWHAIACRMLKLTITFLFICLACVTRATMACSCVSNIEVAHDFRRSALVVDATVLTLEDASVEWRQLKGWVMSGFDRKALSWTEFGGLKVRLEVHEVWKGRQARQLSVFTASDGAQCGWPFFEAGQRYVVYAFRHADGEYEVSLCSRTQPRRDSEVAALRGLAKSKTF
jgi:hypothetical protein